MTQDEAIKQIAALELLVLYVRSQFHSLHSLSREQIILKRVFEFEPFDESLFKLVEVKP